MKKRRAIHIAFVNYYTSRYSCLWNIEIRLGYEGITKLWDRLKVTRCNHCKGRVFPWQRGKNIGPYAHAVCSEKAMVTNRRAQGM